MNIEQDIELLAKLMLFIIHNKFLLRPAALVRINKLL